MNHFREEGTDVITEKGLHIVAYQFGCDLVHDSINTAAQKCN